MTTRRPLGSWGALLLPLALAASGCGKHSDPVATAPDPGLSHEASDDLVLQLVTALSIAGGDLEASVQSATSATASAAGARPAGAAGDTTYSRDGLTYEASQTFYDAQGTALPGFDASAARLRWTSRAYGTYQGPRATATVGHAARLDTRGIEASSDTLRFDGQCLDTLTSRFLSFDGQQTRDIHWTGALTFQDVRISKTAFQSGGFPSSGLVLLVITADRLRSADPGDVEERVSSFLLVRFDGTREPTIQVNACFTYRWNMLTGQITPV